MRGQIYSIAIENGCSQAPRPRPLSTVALQIPARHASEGKLSLLVQNMIGEPVSPKASHRLQLFAAVFNSRSHRVPYAY